METLPPTRGLEILALQQLADSEIQLLPGTKVCTAGETELPEVLRRLHDETRRSAIISLKDKFAFRQMLSGMFPDIEFRRIQLHDLPKESLARGRRYVVKPTNGCFGIGVRTISTDNDLHKVVADIDAELQKASKLLGETQLSDQNFLVESFVAGDEYAVDMFYDRSGEPVITNVYHHPMPAHPAYLHMLYYTSRQVFETIHDSALDFFARLNRDLGVASFPIHAEFRLTERGLRPIELNPLRFGGMGLGNLGYHAFGLNAYQCFVDDVRPDWSTIWRDKSDIAYGYVIAYNGAHVDVTRSRPDWQSLRRLFRRILLEVPFDYQTQPVFGMLYVAGTQADLLKLLDTEFDDYFVPART